jgi:hypothetical protein
MEVESLAFDPKKWFDQPNVENLLDFLALPQEIHAVRGMMDDVLKKGLLETNNTTHGKPTIILNKWLF